MRRSATARRWAEAIVQPAHGRFYGRDVSRVSGPQMTARGRNVERVLPAVAVGLGLGHSAFLGGLATPVTFTRAVLAVGVMCPLMMTHNSNRVGRIVLRPRARLLPLLTSILLGPALALLLGRYLLSHRPEQATALLVLSVLPGSVFAPIWASARRSNGSTPIALLLMGWGIAAFVSLPILVGSHASVACAIALRDLVLLGLAPLGVGQICRVALLDAFEDETAYATHVEPIRHAVLQASLVTLLFTTAASEQVAAVIRAANANLNAVAAVALLYLGLGLGSWWSSLAFRRRFSRVSGYAALAVTGTRQTALAVSVLPLAVAPSALASALAVPLLGLVIELVVGTLTFVLRGSLTRAPRYVALEEREGRTSIVPQ